MLLDRQLTDIVCLRFNDPESKLRPGVWKGDSIFICFENLDMAILKIVTRNRRCLERKSNLDLAILKIATFPNLVGPCSFNTQTEFAPQGT